MNFPYNAAICDSAGVIYIIRNGEMKAYTTLGSAYDIYALDGGRIAYGSICDGDKSGMIITDEDGNILQRYITHNDVFGVWPFEKGYLVGELTTKSITWLDFDLNVVKNIPIRYDGDNMHEVMRGVQIARDGNIWAIQPGDMAIRKYDWDGNILEEIKTGPDTFGLEELENSDIIYTEHKALVWIDSNRNEIRRVTPEDIPEAGLQWALNFKLLSNGHVLLINWLGHGCEGMGCPVIELDKDWKLFALHPVTPNAIYISDIALLK